MRVRTRARGGGHSAGAQRRVGGGARRTGEVEASIREKEARLAKFVQEHRNNEQKTKTLKAENEVCQKDIDSANGKLAQMEPQLAEK